MSLNNSLFPDNWGLQDVDNASAPLVDFPEFPVPASPFGQDSLFVDKEGYFIGTQIDINKLLYDIASYSRENKTIDFNANNYRSNRISSIKFETQNGVHDINARLNTLDGSIDFSREPTFRFRINFSTQKISYELLYSYTTYKDSKDRNKYAIILSLDRGTDFFSVLNFLDKRLMDRSMKKISEEYNKAFKEAGNNPEVLDFLYETVPDYVLQERDEKLLYNDLKLLSGKRIDTIGTNENIAIINIINTLNQSKWFYHQVNANPFVVRKLFKNFSRKHIENLMAGFIAIGLEFWNDKDFENALYYNPTPVEIKDTLGEGITRIAFWCGYIESKNKYEVGFTLHDFKKPGITANDSQPTTLGMVQPFAPLEVNLSEDDVIYIPAFVAEYFTNQQLEEDSNIMLNNIATAVLPELTLAKVRPFMGLENTKLGQLIESKQALKTIDDAIQKLGINVALPKNLLDASQSLKRLERIIRSLKTKRPVKAFNPNKPALKELGIRLPKSKNGLSVDFTNTPYLYPVSGNQKNILKIKLTGNDLLDKKLANELAGFKRNPKDYTWHHLDDYDPITNTCTMQLIETSKHVACNPHYGAVKMAEEFFNFKYTTR